MNNKGFMMAEVIVVSAIIITIIGSFYVSYNKIYALYKTKTSYYDTVTLYRLGYYRDFLIQNNNESKTKSLIKEAMEKSKQSTNATKSINLNDMLSYTNDEYIGDTVYMFYNNKQSINKPNDKMSQTFKDYINYLKDSAKLNSNYVMVLESCEVVNKNVNMDKCKYAYLEVYDEQIK